MSRRWSQETRVIAVGLVLLGGCSSQPPSLNISSGESTSTGESPDASQSTTGGSTDSGTEASSTTDGSTTDAPPSGSESTSSTSSGEGPDETDGETTSGGSESGTASSSSSTGVEPGEPECDADPDCQLVNDCCNCLAIPVGEAPPLCDIQACLVSTCTAQGMSDVTAVCFNRECTLSNAF